MLWKLEVERLLSHKRPNGHTELKADETGEGDGTFGNTKETTPVFLSLTEHTQNTHVHVDTRAHTHTHTLSLTLTVQDVREASQT